MTRPKKLMKARTMIATNGVTNWTDAPDSPR